MAASQHTTNYNLPIFEPNDIPQWLGDSDSWNSTMKALDTAIHEAAQGGGGGGSIEIAQTTGQSTTAVMSQKAVTDNLALKANTADIPAAVTVVQETGDSPTSVMSQAAVTAALAGSGGIKVVEGIKFTVNDEEFPVLALKINNYLLIGAHLQYRQTYGTLTPPSITIPPEIQIKSSADQSTRYSIGSLLYTNTSVTGAGQLSSGGIVNIYKPQNSDNFTILNQDQINGMSLDPFNWTSRNNILISMHICALIPLTES